MSWRSPVEKTNHLFYNEQQYAVMKYYTYTTYKLKGVVTIKKNTIYLAKHDSRFHRRLPPRTSSALLTSVAPTPLH
jgi:hypothetical protein